MQTANNRNYMYPTAGTEYIAQTGAPPMRPIGSAVAGLSIPWLEDDRYPPACQEKHDYNYFVTIGSPSVVTGSVQPVPKRADVSLIQL